MIGWGMIGLGIRSRWASAQAALLVRDERYGTGEAIELIVAPQVLREFEFKLSQLGIRPDRAPRESDGGPGTRCIAWLSRAGGTRPGRE